MKKAGHVVVRLLGLRRGKPKTRWGRVARRMEHGLTLLLSLYALLLVFPQPLFGSSTSVGNIRVYTRDPVAPDSINLVLERAEALIETSEIYDSEMRFDVFSCGSFGLYAFFAPASRNAFACTNIPGNIFIAKSDFSKDLSYRRGHEFSEAGARYLSGVIAHEITHRLIKRKVGCRRHLGLPKWKEEGYCEVVARGRAPNLAAKIRESQSSAADTESADYKYAQYRLLVDYMMQVENMTFMDIQDSDIDSKKVDSEMREWATMQQ